MATDLAVGAVSALAAFAVGLGKGGLAAMGSFGVPLMALVMSPVRAAAVLLPVYVFSDVFAVALYRRDYSARNVKILLPAAAFGIGLGWAFAASVSDRAVEGLVDAIGLAYCANTWRLRHRPVRPHAADVPRGLFWGTLLGASSFVAHAGAPAFQLYVQPQRLPKLVYAGTGALVFAVVNVLKLLPYWALGQFSAENLALSLGLCVPAFVGTQAGRWVVTRVSETAYRRFLMAALVTVSVQLLVHSLRG